MKKAKNGLIAFLALAMSAGTYGIALADSRDSGDNEVKVGVVVSASTSVQLRDKDDDRDEGSSSEVRNTLGSSSKERGDEDNNGTSSRAEEHRSEVAKFVQGLLRIADRDGGIGMKVREVARDVERDQASSTASTTEAIKKVENRSKIKSFFLGSDFKNLGVLRSELARTSKIIDRLSAIASSTTDVTFQTQIQAQIKVLQDDQAKVNAFVKEHESAFSLFGWFVKYFNK